jgi:hypothetical protein
VKNNINVHIQKHNTYFSKEKEIICPLTHSFSAISIIVFITIWSYLAALMLRILCTFCYQNNETIDHLFMTGVCIRVNGFFMESEYPKTTWFASSLGVTCQQSISTPCSFSALTSNINVNESEHVMKLVLAMLWTSESLKQCFEGLDIPLVWCKLMLMQKVQLRLGDEGCLRWLETLRRLLLWRHAAKPWQCKSSAGPF